MFKECTEERWDEMLGGDHGGLYPELIGRAALALAYALGLGGMEGIQLPSALALLLRADLTGARDRCFERGLDLLPAGDLTANSRISRASRVRRMRNCRTG